MSIDNNNIAPAAVFDVNNTNNIPIKITPTATAMTKICG